MTTTAASLVDRIRNILVDYGDGSTELGAAVTSTSSTSFTLDSIDGIEKDSWLMVDYELVEVTAVAEGPPAVATVRRGSRGSTAATHAIDAVVRINPDLGNHDILNALNAAQSRLTKVVTDSATLSVSEDDYDYDVPSTIDEVYRVEIEDSDEASQFYPIRNWDLLDNNTIRLYGYYESGRNIRIVGVSKFDAMTATGNLDTSFPDTNLAAINYLIYAGVAPLLLQRQATVARRDSFVGITDAFAASQPDHSARTSRYYVVEAEKMLRTAVRQCPILQTPVYYTANPGRSYIGRK